MSDRKKNILSIDVSQTEGLGSPWIVRVYERGRLFPHKISSDWFLDEGQARRYARVIQEQLTNDGHLVETLQDRKPGWVLRKISQE